MTSSNVNMNTDFRYRMDLICQCSTEWVIALDKYLLVQTSESYYRILHLKLQRSRATTKCYPILKIFCTKFISIICIDWTGASLTLTIFIFWLCAMGHPNIYIYIISLLLVVQVLSRLPSSCTSGSAARASVPASWLGDFWWHCQCQGDLLESQQHSG